MTRSAADAIAWGRAQIANPSQDWHNKCLIFVRSCFGVAARYPDAGKAWDNAQHRHVTSDASSIPAGVPVFWETSGVYDHVATSTGHGRCLSTDINRRGRVDEVTIDEITRRWNCRLLGWTEDVNGVRVYTPAPQYTRGKKVDRLLRILRRAIRGTQNTTRIKTLRAARRKLLSLPRWRKR